MDYIQVADLQQLAVSHPGEQAIGPGSDRKFGLPHAETMCAGGIDMHLGRDTLLLEVEVKIDRGDYVRRVIVRARQECWRSVFGHRDGAWLESGIHNHREVGTRTLPFDGIG